MTRRRSSSRSHDERLGYGDLAPITLPAKIAVGLEGILATGWLVVVFGAVTAYLQPRLPKLMQGHNSEEPLVDELRIDDPGPAYHR